MINSIAYHGVMGGSINGFTKALESVCDNFQDATTLSEITDADLIFLQTQDNFLPITELQRLKGFKILWSGDARNVTPQHYIDYAPHVDMVCFSNMRDVNVMRSLGYKSEFLQIGYDPEIYTPIGSKVKCPEIVFMGNNNGGFPLSGLRQTMVAYLKDIYGDNFGYYGIGWDKADGNFMGNQLGEAEIYRSAKIGINLSHYDYEWYTSDRLFRMLGSGICVLSHNFTNWNHNFSTNEVCVWDDLEALKSQIDYYLIENAQRNMIANFGHELALSKYTFKKMCENIVNLYKS